MPTIESICHKHVARGVTADQHDAVGECLLFSIQDVLKNDVTPQVMEAWKQAYIHMKQIFVKMELRLSSKLSEKAGFSGFTEMRVASIDDKENHRTIHLVLEGKNNWQVSSGQFLAIDVQLGTGARTMTSMPIIDGPLDHHTVGVARSAEKASLAPWETSCGSVILVSMPCGLPKPMSEE